tara:strand:- start:311 stop:541 length:231 start_codon:yes stop_codon:yes gene_type:complete
VNADRLKKIFKRYPYVPEVGDMSITMNFILQRAPHYLPESMDKEWGVASTNDKHALPHYMLKNQWSDFRSNHLAWR